MDFSDLEFSDFVIVALLPFIFFVILTVHEFGHYVSARFFKLAVPDFVIGAGRELWNRADRKGTRWSLRLYPLWAHVHIEGFQSPRIRTAHKLTTILAGPVFNMMLPFLLFLAFFVCVGQPVTPAILTGIEIGDAADRAGLEPGDEVIAIHGKPVRHYKEVVATGYDHNAIDIPYTIRRNGEVMDVLISPSFLSFEDIDGIDRAYPRLGVQWRQKSLKLEAVHSVNGVDTKGDLDKARELVMHNFGRRTVIGLYSNDGKVHEYRVNLVRSANPDIDNSSHEEHDRVFLGAGRDDVYLRHGFIESIAAAAVSAGAMIRDVAGLPLQLFPLDPDKLAPGSAVTGAETWLANKAFIIVHITSLASVFLALVNLLPLPRLDGGHALLYGLEALARRALTTREKALALVVTFSVCYAAVALFNYDNVPRYLEIRLNKVRSLVTEGEQKNG